MTLVVVIVFMIGGWAYASSLLRISNTATIHTGSLLQATGAVTEGTQCSSISGMYSGSPSISWNVSTGSVSKNFVCIQNIGQGTYHVAITSTLTAAQGAIMSPQMGDVVLPGGFLLLELDWEVPADAQLGVVSFAVSIG